MGFKLSDWNEIIRRINALVEDAKGCRSLFLLPEVAAPHKWSRADVLSAQDTLKEICSQNQFSDVPRTWKQSTIDEINDAIDRGWCGCESCGIRLVSADSIGPVHSGPIMEFLFAAEAAEQLNSEERRLTGEAAEAKRVELNNTLDACYQYGNSLQPWTGGVYYSYLWMLREIHEPDATSWELWERTPNQWPNGHCVATGQMTREGRATPQADTITAEVFFPGYTDWRGAWRAPSPFLNRPYKLPGAYADYQIRIRDFAGELSALCPEPGMIV